ncbi:MAG: hypothetical protein IPM42_14690 [Saprospiraceae bacterium]|nr:hypothetical protein [Saprospiraceae bacterium]
MQPSYCTMPQVKEREFSRNVGSEQERMIRLNEKKWANGTKLKYYFFKGSDGSPNAWKGSTQSINIVKNAFKKWMDVGIGIQFEETNVKNDSQIRIGFDRNDGAWSYLGRDIIDLPDVANKNKRTMNLGWDSLDTAIHEIGHTLGFPHEHQNPKAGIVWDEPAVYNALAAPPNNWSNATTYHNIIRKISPDSIQGSDHDADSIMHYPFGPGLILSPVKYRNGIRPAGGLSPRDLEWVKFFYPKLNISSYITIKEAVSESMNILPGEQKNFIFKPPRTKRYNIATFGEMDTVMVLFEKNGNDEIYLEGDDDSGQDYNAQIVRSLDKNKEYFIRIRLYYKNRDGNGAVMVW